MTDTEYMMSRVLNDAHLYMMSQLLNAERTAHERAVAALQEARDFIHTLCIAINRDHVDILGRIDTVLNAPTCKAAGEVYKAQHRVIELARKHPCPDGDGGGGCMMCAAIEDMDETIAAVDARKGVKP